VIEEIKLAGKGAFWPKSSLGNGLDFAVQIRIPGQDQAGIRIPDPPEQNTIQQLSHLQDGGTGGIRVGQPMLDQTDDFCGLGGIEKAKLLTASAASFTASLVVGCA
jgi:hypothetical protein